MLLLPPIVLALKPCHATSPNPGWHSFKGEAGQEWQMRTPAHKPKNCFRHV
jgi:hypothetical protein